MKLGHEHAPQALTDKIHHSLGACEAKSKKEKLYLFSSLTLICLLLIVPVVIFLKHDLSESGFMSYVSLLFSDTGALVPLFKEFGLSLVESLPVVTVAIAVAFTSLFLWSLLSLASAHLRSRRRVNA